MSAAGPVHEPTGRPLRWLMRVLLLAGVGLAVAAMLVEDRRGPLLAIAVGCLAAAAVVGIAGGGMARRRAPATTPTSGVVTGSAATTSAFVPEPATAPTTRLPAPFGALAAWGVRSVDRLATLPARMLRLFGVFFLVDAAVLVAMAVAFEQARAGLVASAAVLVLLAMGAFAGSRAIGRKTESLLGANESAGGDGQDDLGSIGGLLRLAQRMAGSAGDETLSFDIAAAAVPGTSSPDGLKTHLDRVGVAGSGTIQQVVDTGVLVNGSRVLAVTMSVSIPGKPGLTSSTAAIVEPGVAARLTPGAAIPVRIDPANPQMIQADWAGA